MLPKCTPIQGRFLITNVKNQLCRIMIFIWKYNHSIYCLHFLTLIQWSFLGRLFYLFLLDKWFFDILYNIYVVQFLFNCGFYITYIIVDKGFIENIGPFGIINFFSYSTRFFTISGILYNHALFIFLSLIFLFHFVFK